MTWPAPQSPSVIGVADATMLLPIVESAPAAIAVLAGPDHRFVLANAAYRALQGAPDRPILGRPFAEVFPTLATRERLEVLNRVHDQGCGVALREFEVCLGPASQPSWWDVQHVPYVGESGAVEGVLVIATDVTEKVLSRRRIEELAAEAGRRAAQAERAEGELRRETEARSRLASIVENSEDFIAMCGLDGGLCFVNEAGRRVLGLAADAGPPPLLPQVFTPEDRVYVETVILPTVASAGRWRGEAALLMQGTGERIPFGFNIFRIGNGEYPPALACVAIDLRDRKRAEEQLRQTHAQVVDILESIGDAFYSVDRNWCFTYVNQRAARIAGLAPARMLGRKLSEVFPNEWGSELAAHLKRAMGRQDPIHVELVGPLTGRWIETSIYPSAEGLSVYCRDIHARKQAEQMEANHRRALETEVRERTAELEASLQRLRVTDRLAAIGTLSAGIGHDMGNLLLPVRVRLQAMQARGLPAEFAPDVEAIGKAAEYLQRLTNGLRLLALDPQEDGQSGEVVDLAEWWADAEPLLRNVLPRQVLLEHLLPPQAPRLRVARHRLTQAVFNLVQNAGDAFRGAGRTEGRVRVSCTRATGPWLQLVVEDDGPGMTADHRRRCLEPFFTTKARTLSTGLGLALVRGIVEQAGGTVSVESAPGRGATFRLTLPAAPAAGDGAAARRLAVVSLRDIRMRTYVASVLAGLAYDVRLVGAGHLGHEAGEARLWVTDAAAEVTPEAREPGRRVVLFGELPDHAALPGVVEIGARPKPAAIREALREASG